MSYISVRLDPVRSPCAFNLYCVRQTYQIAAYLYNALHRFVIIPNVLKLIGCLQPQFGSNYEVMHTWGTLWRACF